MVSASHQSMNDQTLVPERSVQQKREQVSKQVLYTQNHQRLQTRLRSAASELVFHQNGSVRDFQEHFDQLNCEMQEKIYERAGQKEQLVRSLRAEKGVYSYQTGKLEAGEVALSRLIVMGDQWPIVTEQTPLLFKGTAAKIQFSLFKELSFKAQGLQASFFNWGEE